jgi:NADPH:quinone reductase-like Zn-dependent oxidoreductase
MELPSVVVGGEAVQTHPQARLASRFAFGPHKFVAALAGVKAPAFDPDDAANADRVLLEIDAFSCNFRDRARLLTMLQGRAPATVTPLGSEFCARVVGVGTAVSELSVGDRVFTLNTWPEPVAPGVRPGVPTDQASRRVRVLDRRQVLRVPVGMPDEDAAAFTVGAQTTYAMVRRLALAPGEPVVVTAASSATSQFAIRALRNDPADPRIVALTGSDAGARAATESGASDVLTCASGAEPTVGELAAQLGGFAAVIDPFYDVHLPHIARHLRNGGRYITCGSAATHEGGARPGQVGDYQMLKAALSDLMIRNASFIGNCIGARTDLERAIGDYEAGRLAVPLDSVHTGAPAPFFERTWNDPNRVGKVVYRYER